MNISYNWLKKYLQTDVSADELAKILTSIGLEVGMVEQVQTIKGGLEGLVVGEVLTCNKHENSDHLHVTMVNIGSGEPLQIVCGAPNVAAGQKVIVATVGTKLYQGEETFTIKRSKIRGVELFGMICAEDEIGVGTSHEGIIVLPAETKVGMLAKDYFNVQDDTVIEVDITPNRADAISHYGVARDLAAYFFSKGLPFGLTRPSVDDFKVNSTKSNIDIAVKNAEACLRYAGVVVSGVTIKKSPKWLQDTLNVIGIRPINNVVDISNYLLHAFGQPLHTFDADKIEGDKIVVRTAQEGEKFVTLDGVERTLCANDLMICDATKPMCIAGVFGGLDLGITDATTSVFIESAYFNPVFIRKTARRFGLHTDASFRFERGVDPNQIIYVLKLAALMIKELAGGEIASEITDIYPSPINDFTVTVSIAKMDSLIGKSLGRETIEKILKGLEIKVLSFENDTYTLSVPSYRVDVQRDVDIIEDVLRIYGYNNVEISSKVNSSLNYGEKPDTNKLQYLVSEQLSSCGFYEILNNSLTKTLYYERLKQYPLERCVKLINPLSNDLGVMRQTLLFGGLESIAYNINRQNADLKFYELGNCYWYDATKGKDDDALSHYGENYRLGLWLTGKRAMQSWLRPSEKTSFYELRAHTDNVLRKMGIAVDSLKLVDLDDELYSEALLLKTASDKTLGTIGIVKPEILRWFDISVPVYFAELDWNCCLREGGKHKIVYKEISKFPEVKRDLALLVDKNIKFFDIEKVAFDVERKLLKKVSLFDVYEGKNLEDGKKSYAVNFVLQDKEKTLTDKQIDSIMQRLIKAFEEKLNAKLR